MPRHRRILRLLAALAVCGVLVLSACSSSSGGKDFSFTSKNKRGTLISESKRKPAQDIGGELISSGKRVTLAANKGHVTVLNFFASWCSPCKVETPQLDLFYRQMKTKGLHFIGFDTHDDKGAGKAFIAQNDISFPVVFDQESEVQLKLGNIPGVLPFTVLVDKQGRVAAVYIDKLTPKDLQGPVDTLLAER
ncbi:TlpA family protein disulfide reductase [uncultured Jatrophihabitans sp.]|uniref:TlpA family protein disulfide reductase n=1 Tax=uncultured Jatrophihabitans sp. TaxID=1610747 RepID=UPI0035CB4B30